MIDWVPHIEREEFKDLVGVEEFPADVLVSRISYTPQFASTFSYFRAIILANEYSERGFKLCNEVIQLCPGFYSAWDYRREVITHLSISPESELEFLNKISVNHPKNYQIWPYRRDLINIINNPAGELDFLSIIFDLDSKNIHAWGYRQWLVIKFNLWEEDRQYAIKLITQDPFNNSAWNEKMFVAKHDGTFEDYSKKTQEIEFILNYCEEQTNECPFNYLRALYSPETEELIKQGLLQLLRKNGVFVNLLKILSHIYEIDANLQLKKICYTKLQVEDFRRSRFWAWKLSQCTGSTQLSPTDTKILQILQNQATNVMFEYYWNTSKLPKAS